MLGQLLLVNWREPVKYRECLWFESDEAIPEVGAIRIQGLNGGGLSA
jgi:hypothetical protein